MAPGTKRNILFVVAVGAAASAIYFLGFEPRGVIASFEVKPDAANIEGEVLSVESTSERKEAVVRLVSGQTVRAYVPPACLVFPGQVARMSRFGSGGAQSLYVVNDAREKTE
jgi:hypothetical protein